MAKGPTSVKVVSILGIILSSMGLLATPCGIFMLVHPITSNPVADALIRDRGYLTITFVSSGVSLCTGLLLLASSIGSLKLRPWGRVGMNVYAVLHILTGVAGAIVSLVYVLPLTRAAMADSGIPEAKTAMVIGVVSLVVGLLLALGVSTVILIVFNRRAAVDAFQGILPEEAGNYPGELNG
jgi:hypothetical protein